MDHPELIAAIARATGKTELASATAPSRDSVAGPFALSNNDTLNVTLNGTAVVVTFTTSMFVATAAEVVAAINARLASLNPSVRAVASVQAGAVRIATTWRGTGSSINVTGGTANTALQFTTGNLPGGGNDHFAMDRAREELGLPRPEPEQPAPPRGPNRRERRAQLALTRRATRRAA